MNKLDLSRRQFLNTAAVAGGLYMMSNASSVVLGEEVSDVKENIPFINSTEDGPLYPPTEIPWLQDLTTAGQDGGTAAGQPLYLFGQVFNVRGLPIENAVVEIWQADNNGLYKHPRIEGVLDPNFGYFGKVKTAADGTYLFKTIVPHWYGIFGIKRANHIHIKIRHKDHGVSTTEVYFAGEEQDDIRKNDHVFQSRRDGDGLIVSLDDPATYSDLGIAFDADAKCSKHDMAFIL